MTMIPIGEVINALYPAIDPDKILGYETHLTMPGTPNEHLKLCIVYDVEEWGELPIVGFSIDTVVRTANGPVIE